MIDSRRTWTAFAVLAVAALWTAQPARSSAKPGGSSSYPLPQAWAGDWEGVDFEKADSGLPKDLKVDPPFDAADPLIISHLTPWGAATREATSYDDAPGSLCGPEGWFPFINYGYGFALLSSAQKITMIPVEPDTEGIRRVYLKSSHGSRMTPTWNGDSIAHWEGDALVIDTIGYNSLSWLGDDREPHSTALHMVERMRLVHDGKYLQVIYEIEDPKVLRSAYKLTRYFSKVNTAHLGAGPSRNDIEWVCNEDLSPFAQGGKKAATK